MPSSLAGENKSLASLQQSPPGCFRYSRPVLSFEGETEYNIRSIEMLVVGTGRTCETDTSDSADTYAWRLSRMI